MTQAERIMQYMSEFGGITQFEALRDLGVMRLASRISEMRRNGVKINDKMISVKNRYGETVHVKRYEVAHE